MKISLVNGKSKKEDINLSKAIYGNDFNQYLERKNIKYENLSEEQIQINFEEFSRIYEPSNILKTEVKNFVKKNN